MYLNATGLVNLVLKTFVQLFHMQVHTPRTEARCEMLFSVTFFVTLVALCSTVKQTAP